MQITDDAAPWKESKLADPCVLESAFHLVTSEEHYQGKYFNTEGFSANNNTPLSTHSSLLYHNP